MRRFSVLLTVVAIVLLSSGVVLSRPSASAQEATPAAMAAHPVVGEWRFTNVIDENISFPSLAIFHADGTYIEDLPDAGSFLMGVWEPTGERTALLTVYSVYVIDDKLANGEGRFTIEVDETGTTLTSTGTFVGTFEDGSIDIAVDVPTTATRLGTLPVVPLSELVPGGTPVIPADLTGEATPVP